MGVLIITHYQRILHMVIPQFVHIMFDGRIVKEGGPELVTELEKRRLRLDPRRGRRGGRMSLTVPPRRRVPRPRARGRSPTSTPPRRRRRRARVIEAMDRYYLEARATVHRAIYALAAEATEMFEGARDARRRVHRLDRRRDDLHPQRHRGDQPRRVVVGPRQRRRRATVIAVTQMEHHSNLVPWQMLAQERGATLAYVAVDDDGLLDLDALDAAARARAEAASPSRTSPTCSATINPVAEIARRAHAAGAVVRGRRRAGRAARCRSTSPRSAPTSTPGPGTRPTARPASASCTGAASCSRRCRRSSAAGT